MSSKGYQPLPQNQPSVYHSGDDSPDPILSPPAYALNDSPLLRPAKDKNDLLELHDEYPIDIRHAFIRKVYAILTVQLAATAIFSSISFFNITFKSWIQSNAWMMFISLFGSLSFLLLTSWKSKSYPMNLFFLSGFTLMEAYLVAVITSFYESRVILQTVVIAGPLFLALTVFAMQTKYDFASWYPHLYGALWLGLIFGFAARFFPSCSGVELACSGGIAVLFSVFVLVDTQRVMTRVHVDEEIHAVLSLYLDILNLLLKILAILRVLSGDDDKAASNRYRKRRRRCAKKRID
ncbi:hypothetical protein RUND412_008744 [Rhizina undulata]